MKKTRIFALLLGGIFSLGISGCSTKIPVQKEVGQLNLQYQNSKEDNANPQSIAIVDPKFEIPSDSQAQGYLTHPITGQKIPINQHSQFSFNSQFNNTYADRTLQAMRSEFEEILTSKGFRILGPYQSFDDMPYSDKKKAYLSLIPEIKINFDTKTTNMEQERLYVTQKGILQVSGEMVIYVTEPLTKEKIMTKRINLSDFNIAKPFIRQYQTRTKTGGITGAALDKATAPESLVDNTDKAMTEAINEFYAQAMTKIDRYLATEEIMAYQKDIESLKNLKRF